MLAQMVGSDFGSPATHVGAADHPAPETLRLNGYYGTFLQFACRIEGGLNLPQFDAISTHFDLRMRPPDEIDDSGLVLPSEIAGAVQASSRIGTPRIA